MTCEARHYSDQTVCSRCGLAWDRNDPVPPPCGKEARVEQKKRVGAAAVARIRQLLGLPPR